MAKRFCLVKVDACELVTLAQMCVHTQNRSYLHITLNMQHLNPKSFTWILHNPNKIHGAM
jgi:hypothetical protein